jgi:hypothetical protein
MPWENSALKRWQVGQNQEFLFIVDEQEFSSPLVTRLVARAYLG